VREAAFSFCIRAFCPWFSCLCLFVFSFDSSCFRCHSIFFCLPFGYHLTLSVLAKVCTPHPLSFLFSTLSLLDSRLSHTMSGELPVVDPLEAIADLARAEFSVWASGLRTCQSTLADMKGMLSTLLASQNTPSCSVCSLIGEMLGAWHELRGGHAMAELDLISDVWSTCHAHGCSPRTACGRAASLMG